MSDPHLLAEPAVYLLGWMVDTEGKLGAFGPGWFFPFRAVIEAVGGKLPEEVSFTCPKLLAPGLFVSLCGPYELESVAVGYEDVPSCSSTVCVVRQPVDAMRPVKVRLRPREDRSHA